MKYEKTDIKKDTVRFSITIAGVIIIFGALLSFGMYFVIDRSFFQATAAHEVKLMSIMEKIGSQLIDYKLRDIKEDAQNVAKQFEEMSEGSAKEHKQEILSMLPLGEYGLNYCYQTRQELYTDGRFNGDYAALLDLSQAWEGKTVLFSPDFDEEGNYILAIAVPVWENQQETKPDGILIKQMDGYCISHWIADLFLPLDFGTAYIVDKEGRNIATVREENYDWITSRYNAQELIKESDDETTKGVARLEKRALVGETGVDTYEWGEQTSYVAFGPMTEEPWGFFVGFYGNQFASYTKKITMISSSTGGIMLGAFALFLGTIIIVVIRNLAKERRYSEMLMRQKTEIEQQALRIAASEERFRIAMRRNKDIILEYQLETEEIVCFHADREIKCGRVRDESLRRRLVEEYCMDEDSFERFQEVMAAISRGLMSAECMVSGDYGEGRRWYNMSVSAIPNKNHMSTRAIGVLRDVTLEREAELDSLTRLLNKSAMTVQVKQAMQEKQVDSAGAFIMLDMDYFKRINDQYGHPVGDQVLCAVAGNLRLIFPKPDLTGRFGGDEFSVYCPAAEDAQELEKRLRRLLERVKKIRVKDCNNLLISLSIGAVIFYGKADFEEIYKKADEMLYEVKENGRDNCRIFVL